MLDTVTRYLSGINELKWRVALRNILAPLADGLSSVATSTAGLVIGTSDNTTAKIGAAIFNAMVGGRVVTLAAGTELPKPLGLNLTTGQFGIGCWFVDGAGTVTFAAGTPGATAGAATFPPRPLGRAIVGYILVTMAGTFTGGTTALSGATTTYNSPVGAFDPSAVV